MAVLKLVLIGKGLVGSELLNQLRLTAQSLTKHRNLQLQVVGVATSSQMLLSQNGLPLDISSLDGSWITTNLDALVSHLLGQGKPKHVLLVDCTANESVAQQYTKWLRQGVHVVTPNKKAFSGSQQYFDEIQTLRSSALCLHEATVGAGLPVINTLSDLTTTGDSIVQIEGILSGTLSYLFNTFCSSTNTATFSEIVKDARAKGYTEPDPRDDLNGLDFARKVVILGRCSGSTIDLSSLEVENIVPEPLRTIESVDEFLSRLSQYDSHFEQLRQDALNQQQVLRYVGVVSPTGKSFVRLQRYPSTHPFASLQGSTNIVAFTTARYPNPLIIQGAGAGAVVTAMGVFGDILKVALTLGL